MKDFRSARLAAFCIVLLLGGCGPAPPAGSVSDLALLAQGADGFTQARPGLRLQFPRDHGPHPEFRIEWWYLTANLEDGQAQSYGAQWTLFRFAVRPRDVLAGATAWQTGQVFMAHLGITTPEGHFAAQRYARGGDHAGIAQAGVRTAPFAAWLDDWSLVSTSSEWLPLQVSARQGRFAIDLRLEATGPLVLQGESGFSQKHPDGGGSYYYSQPFLAVSGTLQLDGRSVPVSGQGWLDREWSSQFLQPDQAGWDWFALHLDSGEKLMLFRLRGRDGRGDYRHAVLISPAGASRELDSSLVGLEVLEEMNVRGRRLPLRWRIDLPEIDRMLEVEALHAEQWMDVDFPYWEGVVSARGSGPGSSGKGYLELTGYTPR